ncbi:MAG: transglutaminase family protein [Rhodobacteraceae bacterium]|nr:transglutaminase family protein [Paracoccaceae bacterium]
MLYRIRLCIDYRFARATGAGRQQFRILPAALPGVQTVAAESVSITPEPLETLEFTDFFGTRVIEAAMPPGLTSVKVEMRAEVIRHTSAAEFDISASLADLPEEIALIRDVGREAPHHFLPPSPRLPRVAEITAFAAGVIDPQGTTRQAVQALGEALHEAMTFDAEATEVDTPIAQAFAGRHGVCQDFAQIMIAGLRAHGIPAAYVAGYLRTHPPPGKPRLEGADAMHAWVRAWCGAETGWLDYDPTNSCFVAEDHIVVGHGRDYGDVAPVIGMLRLDGAQEGSHSVDIRPEGDDETAE